MAPPADRIDVRGGARGALSRLVAAWRGLRAVQRMAAYGALGLFVTMFLPWYSKSAFVRVGAGVEKQSANVTAFGAFSFVEAAVLLVAVGVIVLLLARGEGRAFHLPGGDGTVVLAAGVWVCLLVFYRQFDKPGVSEVKGTAATVGVSWGIFVTFLCGLFLAYAGTRLRAAHLGEPPLPGDVAPSDAQAPGPPPAPRRSGRAADRPAEPAEPAAARSERPRPARDQALTVVDPNEATVSTRVVPRRPERPRREDDSAPGQLSFEEDDPGEGPERGERS
jgi:multisubunit Na+/H+ antiporter MnhB subunit